MKYKEIEKEVFIEQHKFYGDEFVIYKEKPDVLYYEAKLIVKIPDYKVKLIRTFDGKTENTKYHLCQSDADHRLPYIQFIRLIRYLSNDTKLISKLNYTLYSGQPVYEFYSKEDVLIKIIKDYINNITVEVSDEV